MECHIYVVSSRRTIPPKRTRLNESTIGMNVQRPTIWALTKMSIRSGQYYVSAREARCRDICFGLHLPSGGSSTLLCPHRDHDLLRTNLRRKPYYAHATRRDEL